MLRQLTPKVRRVLMTVDAVGGVWRYALDLAAELGRRDIACCLAGFGPAPADDQRSACAGLPNVTLRWLAAPLDWMAADETDLVPGAVILARLADSWRADVVQVNVPSQAAGLPARLPVVAVAHSCVATWWRAVCGGALPPAWQWQARRTRAGLTRADAVVVPSGSQAALLEAAYGAIDGLHVVHNASPAALPIEGAREPFVLAAGRWWDEGKNGAALDAAAASSPWPIRLAGPLAGPNDAVLQLHHAQALGTLPPGLLQALMQRAGLFAAPSLYEPFGLAVLEAAQAGAPLLLADIPTFRELWNGAARFVPARDAAAWSAAIRALADDPPAREVLAAAARQRAARFTFQRQADAMAGIYAQVASHHALQPVAV